MIVTILVCGAALASALAAAVTLAHLHATTPRPVRRNPFHVRWRS